MMAGVGVFLHRRHTHTEKRAVEVDPESEQTMCASVSYLGSSLSWLILIIQVNLLSYGVVWLEPEQHGKKYYCYCPTQTKND